MLCISNRPISLPIAEGRQGCLMLLHMLHVASESAYISPLLQRRRISRHMLRKSKQDCQQLADGQRLRQQGVLTWHQHCSQLHMQQRGTLCRWSLSLQSVGALRLWRPSQSKGHQLAVLECSWSEC